MVRLRWLLGLALLVLLAWPGALQAQNRRLLTEAPAGMAAVLSAGQSTRLNVLSADRTLTDIWLVQVDVGALDDAAVVVDLPGLGAMRLERTRLANRGPGDLTWFGTMQATGNSSTLVVRGSDVTAAIWSGTDQFSLRPIGGGLHVLAKIDPKAFPKDHPPGPMPVAPKDTTLSPRTSVELPVPGLNVTVDILVAYTAAALMNDPGIATTAQLAVDATNAAYLASNAGVQLRLVGTMEVGQYDETQQSYFGLLSDLRNGTLPGMAEVHQRRDALGADLVSMMVAKSDYCGVAYLNASATSAFSVTTYLCAVGNLTFAHELGHNFGSLHDPVTDPGSSPYAYGHGHINGSSWRTIMAYNAGTCNGCPRIGHFSNPSVNYQGTPTGTAAVSDVARLHRERTATVAAFRAGRPTTPTLNVTPLAGFAPTGPVGGPFAPASTTYGLTNPSTVAVNWTATSSNTSVATVGSAGGTLAAGATVNVVVSVPTAANSLAVGEHTASLQFTNTSNGVGSATRTATLNVRPVGPQCTDAVAASPLLTATGASRGSTVGATAETGEANHAGVSTPVRSVWCRWTAPEGGPVTISTAGSNFDTTLAVYYYTTGPAGDTFTLVAENDDAGGGTNSRVTFQAFAFNTYAIAVAGKAGATGNYVLTYDLTGGPPANDNFANAQALIGPEGMVNGDIRFATRETGEPAHYGSDIGGQSLWFKYTATATGPMYFSVNSGGSLGFVIAAYTGPSVGRLTQLGSAKVFGFNRFADLYLQVVSGQTYYFAVDRPNAMGGALFSGQFSLAYRRANVLMADGLFGAVLPYARSVQVGTAATAFANINNTSSSEAHTCGLQLPPNLPGVVPGTFFFRATRADNSIDPGREPNEPVNIAAGATQNFVFGFTPSAAFAATEIPLVFRCWTHQPVTAYRGVNTFLLSAATAPVPDLIAIGTTVTNDGIANVTPPGGVGGLFAAAAINIGVAGSITASVDDGGRGLPLSTFICRTNSSTGACLSPPAASTTSTLEVNEVATYGIFIQATNSVAFDPSQNRLFLRLNDASGVSRGATSVAVQTVAADVPVHASE